MKSLIKTAQWDKAIIKKLTQGDVVKIPLTFSNNIKAIVAEDRPGLSINDVSYLLIYKDLEKKMHAEVVTTLPDENYLKSSTPNAIFSGTAKVEDWNGNFIKGVVYNKDGTALMLLPTTANSSSRQADEPSIFCYTTTWVICVSYEGFVDCRNEEDFVCGYAGTYGDSFPSYGGYDYGSGDGGSHGGGGSANASSVRNVVNDLTNPCLRGVLSSLTYGDLKNDITAILTNTFGQSDLVNVTFGEDNTITNPQTWSQRSGEYLNIYIDLNPNMATASREYIAETMFHEILHAYLDTEPQVKSELMQHVEMATGWIYDERIALQEIFPNLSETDANALILAGFGQLQDIIPSYFDLVLGSYGTNRDNVSAINNSYKQNGTQGSRCN